MYGKIMRLMAVPGRQITNIDAAASHRVRRFIGWKYDPSVGAFVRIVDKPEEVMFHEDYVKAVMNGDLEPADSETAAMCGVEFKASAPAADKNKKGGN